ncbi:MAG TPA: two-component regulator propeller domain-containing protein [Bacteroidales bacterium]|nr:two-component regulator propeller domain-containing protein [Bacteroidales bacterium]
MSFKRYFLVLGFVWLLISTVSGNNSFVFHHLTTNEGLSNNSVKNILKDSYGFLWLGTEFGLNRYDGYNFKTYISKPNTPNSIPANNIVGIQEDGLKNLWIDYGYYYVVYNREKDNFITDLSFILDKLNIKTKGNFKIYVDRSKNLFVINAHEIYYYNVAIKKLRIFKMPILNFSNLEVGDDLNHLYFVDSKDFCWQIEKKSGKINKAILPTGNEMDHVNKHTKIFADLTGGLWLYSGKDEYVNYRQSNTSQWHKIYLNSSLKSQNSIISIVEGRNNQVWIATDHKGLFIYDKSTSSLTNIISNPLNPASIASNNVSSILTDNSGTVWVGHDKKGISYFNDSFQNFINVQYGQCRDISKILELRNGNILLGTDGNGLFIRNLINNQITKLPIANTAITALLEDKKGRVWAGTYQQGLYCIDHNGVKHFSTETSNLSSDNIWGLLEDKYGNIWIGTLGEKIHKYASNNHSNHFDTPFNDTKCVSDMIYDGNETIYVATAYGLTSIDINKNRGRIHLGNKKGSQQFKNQQIFSIYKDSRSLLWLGTNTGLTVWDLRKDTLYYFDVSNGLSDNIIRGITEDKIHNIWVTTSNGLSVLTLENEKSNTRITNNKNFTIKDGLKSNYFNNNAICRLRNGEILVGTTEGYTIIDPAKVAEKKQQLSKIYIIKINIGNTQIQVDSVYNRHVILNKSIEWISELNLKYNDKLITLEFTTVDLINANKVKYRYKIEGFNNQWITSRKNEIAITSLPAGNYKLLIEACNSDGIWNDKAKILFINVAPPFYYSSWAITLYILVVIAFALFLFYRGQKRNQLKLEQQKIKMAHEHEIEMNEMKLRFFTNISHDLRTPLTLIITPLQTMLKDIDDESLSKKLKVMFKNAQQLLNLINSLLDFRKLDVGAERLNLSPVNIVELVNEIYYSFNDYATERKIIFKLNNSIEKQWIDIDRDKILKSIVNLLSNAFKFTPDAGTIELSLFVDGLNVCISVSDTGSGIGDEDKKLIFNRFYQTSYNTKQTGSGIGLHIVSEYVKLHKGSISITDNTPTGSIFTIKVPLIKIQSGHDDNELFEEAVEEIEPLTKHPKKFVILFVDDNKDLCEFIYDSLSSEYTVIVANDGQEALSLLAHHDVNLVVSDVMMPVLDGNELCKSIKSNINWSHIPVILLAARTTEENQIESFELGADDYITKPFNLDILKLRILRIIEWNQKSHHAFSNKLVVEPSEITITSLDEKLIEKAIQIVESHISNSEFSVEMLCDILGFSRGHLYKKLMAITGKGPAEFIKVVRLKRGKQLLGKSQMQIAEIAYEVGFNSPKRFTKKFREEFGMSPTEYIRSLKNNEME